MFCDRSTNDGRNLSYFMIFSFTKTEGGNHGCSLIIRSVMGGLFLNFALKIHLQGRGCFKEIFQNYNKIRVFSLIIDMGDLEKDKKKNLFLLIKCWPT